MVRDVEVVVVDPDRAPAPERHAHHPLAEAWDELQARRDQGAHVVEAEPAVGVEERRALEDRDRTDVHGRLGALEVQEALVERGEAVVPPASAPIGSERMGQAVGSTGPRHEVTP